MPTGGVVEGDIAGLLKGRRARLQLGPRIVAEPGALVIVGLPFTANHDTLVMSLEQACRTWARRGRVRDYLGGQDVPEPPEHAVVDVRDETSMRVGTRIVCVLRPDTDRAAAERWVREVWPVTIEVDCRLPLPQTRRLTGWDRGDGSGLRALADLLGV